MDPYHYTYDLPASMPRYVYGPSPSYSRPEPHYLQALAEEEAARRQYQQALRDQEAARSRAARARLARQAFEAPYDASSYDSYLTEDDDYGFGSSSRGGQSLYPVYSDYPRLSPREQRALLHERQRLEQQRRLEALEREREQERERIRLLEEERRRRLLEAERRRRIMLEEEERQRAREEEKRRREEEDYLRRRPPFTAFSPLDEFFGLRPSRPTQPEMNNSRRARTMSPGCAARGSPATQPHQQPQSQRQTPGRDRSSSRSRIPVVSPETTSKPSAPSSTQSTSSPTTRSHSPRRHTAEEVDAAEKIQNFWRTHRPRRAALASIASLTAKFEQVKSAFTLPDALDYNHDGHVVTVPTAGWDGAVPSEEIERTSTDARLAYTSTNAPVHAYEEELNRILTKLDGVQSGGDELVRNRRRDLARKVEREAERIEKTKLLVWRAWVGGQKEESNSMVIDEEPTANPDTEPRVAASEEADPSPASAECPLPPPDEMQVDAEHSSIHADPLPQPSVTDITLAATAQIEQTLEETPVELSEPMGTDADLMQPNSSTPAVDAAPTPHALQEPTDTTIEDLGVKPDDIAEVMEVDDTPHDSACTVEEVTTIPNESNSPPHDSDDSTLNTVPIIVEEPDPDGDEPPTAEPPQDGNDEVEEEGVSCETIIHPPLSATVTSPPHSPFSPPPLVHSLSEAGDSTPPYTPVETHDELPIEGKKDVDGTITPKPQLISTEKLHMLKPLVCQEWDEEIDFF